MKKVITFGVYDFFHIGHLNLFLRAKALGDYLTVAVQTSEFIKTYKPDAKIFYSTEERAKIIKNLRCVDKVVLYRNVAEDISEMEFDVFARGPDQNHSGFLAAEAWCKSRGKDVVVLPRTEGISSSDIKNNKLK